MSAPSSHTPHHHRTRDPLPKLPLPTISQTLSKLIETTQPYLLSPSELQEFRSLVALAQNSPELHKRQHDLERLREKTDNWLSEAWIGGYMGWSAPLPINSNVATCLVDEHQISWGKDVPEIAARMGRVVGEGWQQVLGAALVTHGALQYHVAMLEGRAPFQLADNNNNSRPVCRSTYNSMFSSTRIPGDSTAGEDHLRKYPEAESTHLAIFSGGRYYSLQVVQSREVIPLPLLFQSFWNIQQETLQNLPSSLPSICTLTAQDRRKWGDVRAKLQASSPINSSSLLIIESSIFTVALDPLPSSPRFTPEPATGNGWVKWALAGQTGESNWFDKSFQFTFSSTGQPAQNIEHSWADAPVPLDMFWNFAVPSAEKVAKDPVALGGLLDNLSLPRRGSTQWPRHVEFCFEEEYVRGELLEAQEVILKAIRDSDLEVLRCKGFGRQIWKKAKLSPDAACQMAFQLAYRRMTGSVRPPATYETIGMTAYREGRTECCKVVSVPSEEFVQKALNYLEALNKQTPQKELEGLRKAAEKALRLACTAHLTYISEGQKGRGIDRHLFGLRTMSKDGNQPALFNHPAFAESGCTGGFVLSTSNNSYIQRHFGAAFGCVVPNGYGLMYVPAKEEFYVSIESKKSCPETNSHHFATLIDHSLRDLARIAGVEVEDSVRGCPPVSSKL